MIRGPHSEAITSGEFDKVNFRSLPQTVAEIISRAILAGSIKPNQRLLEQKLAQEFHIGTPTVREALKELEHQGLVYKVPNRGTYVAQFSEKDATDMLEVRMALESLAVKRATQRMTEVHAKELNHLLEEMESAARSNDFAAYHQNDLAFHHKIWEVSGNQHIAIALEPLVHKLFATSLLPRPNSTEFRSLIFGVEVHRQILQSLCSGNTEQACSVFCDSVLTNWKQTAGVQIVPPGDQQNPDNSHAADQRRRDVFAESADIHGNLRNGGPMVEEP